MKQIFKNILLFTAVMVLGMSCSSTTYAVRPEYVGFTDVGAVLVQQTQKTDINSEELYSTYDDEFIYDEEGNVIKHIQTSYFEKGQKYDEWVVEYQNIGGTTLPRSVAINGVVYMEVEYEILESEHEGSIPQMTSTPRFTQQSGKSVLSFFTGAQFYHWEIDLENIEVPFRSDNRFVTTEESFGIYTGLSMDKVLSLGYDNIVLKKFYYSLAKFNQGYNLSMADVQSGLFSSTDADTDNHNVTFAYVWGVEGGNLTQKEMTATYNKNGKFIKFFIEREFDSAGRRIEEEWKVNDSESYIDKPVTLFKQSLAY